MSKYQFLVEIASRLGLDKGLIKPASVDDSPLKAPRIKNLSLDVSKIQEELGISLPTVEQSIDHFIADLPNNYHDRISDKPFKGEYYPFLNIIPYGRQCLDDEDIAGVLEVLKSSNLTQGPKIEEFECGLMDVTGANFATAVSSATAGLHIACMAAGVGPGDEVITSTNTFLASANCAFYCGAKPVLTDIDDKTYNMSIPSLKSRINSKTKAVIPVHFAGQSCDMQALVALVREAEKKYGHKIYIIEDASHALGSFYQDTAVGSCAFSDMTVMSFHPVKHITTAEGGVILTNDKQLQRKCYYLRSHGITSFADEFTQVQEAYATVLDAGQENLVRNPWYYEQRWLGYNYRITDLQCALGVPQLKKLGRFAERRRQIVELYNKSFKGNASIITPYESPTCRSNFHLYVLRIDFSSLACKRALLMAALRERGILTQVHYIPVHTQPYYQQHAATSWGDHPLAEQYYQQCLSLPLYPGLRDEDVMTIIAAFKEIVRKA